MTHFLASNIDAFDLASPPEGFIENPFPIYAEMRQNSPVLKQKDGSYILTRYEDLNRIYRDTKTFISDKKEVFKPKYGNSPLYEHHTTSLVFNDAPLHTRVRKIMVGAMNPRAIAQMEPGLNRLVDDLIVRMKNKNSVDLIEDFAAAIPVEVIGNLLDIPYDQREPLRDWSLAILGALEPSLSQEQLEVGNKAVEDFKEYLKDVVDDRSRNPGDPAIDVLTRLIQSEEGDLSEVELLQNCIFILNAGHETTTNLIGNALASLYDYKEQCEELIKNPDYITTAIDEFLRFESPNQFGNRLTTAEVEISGVSIPPNSDLHLCIGAANRDPEVFANPEKLDISRKPNKHLAFAGGPHTCVGLSLARMEGRIAVSKFLEHFPNYSITDAERSPRIRFRGYSSLSAELN